jgi:uncharacterized damage-inducible protein DinB
VDQVAYTPAAKCMTALDLAFHIASADVWFLNCVATATYEWTGGGKPEEIKTPADVVAWYDANLPAALDKVKNAPAEILAKEVAVFGPPAANVTYLDLALRHSIHHRGQLSSYLRPMGGKVPAIYGGSADEPMQASA